MKFRICNMLPHFLGALNVIGEKSRMGEREKL
jgi:hypothetical protein